MTSSAQNVVDGDRRHRGVKAVVVEWQPLGRRVERRSKMMGSLRPHRRRRLDGVHVPIKWLVGAGTGTDVDDRPRIAEGGVDVWPVLPKSYARFSAERPALSPS